MFRNPIKSYKTNSEYRQELREFFTMEPNTDFIPSGIDEESYDELLYDSKAVKIGMDTIFEDTKSHIEFQNLYRKAASAMLSEDLETGLAICLCYDHFYMFSNYLCEFYLDIEKWKGLDNPLYIKLESVL
jgi:hypothetical protein